MKKFDEIVSRYSKVIGKAADVLRMIRTASKADQNLVLPEAFVKLFSLLTEARQIHMEYSQTPEKGLTPREIRVYNEQMSRQFYRNIYWSLLMERAIRKRFVPWFASQTYAQQEIILGFCNRYSEELRQAVRINPQGEKCLIAHAFFDGFSWQDIQIVEVAVPATKQTTFADV